MLNLEGLGPLITPEMIQATVTGIPCLVVAYWLIAWAGDLWRHRAWTVAGAEISGLCEALGGTVRPVYGGWRVAVADRYVDYVGGVSGPSTRVARIRSDATVSETREGWLSVSEAQALLASLS